MEFLSQSLDDPASKPCGKCASCQGKPEAMRGVSESLVREAIVHLQRCDLPVELRAQWPQQALPTYGWVGGNIKKELRGEVGRALCILGDSGWGMQVQREREAEAFSDDLVTALVDLVLRWGPMPRPTWITAVPSLARPGLVPDLAQRLAEGLGIPFVPAVRQVRRKEPQAEMDNSWHKANNLDGVFQVTASKQTTGPVLLLDDLTDSGWTLTLVAALLRQVGSGPVFPLTLATRWA
jgi:ATP-dependent DNA helicase RecQ